MDISKLAGDFWKTSGHLKSAVLGASGWDANIVDAELASGAQVFVYYFDLVTKFTWMASIPVHLFAEVSDKSALLNDVDTKIIRDGLQSFAVRAIKIGSDCIKGSDIEQNLGAAIALYAGTTITLRYADGLRNGGHFIVLNYRASPDSPFGLLRPFAAMSNQMSPMAVDELQRMLNDVMYIDRERHPEWFR